MCYKIHIMSEVLTEIRGLIATAKSEGKKHINVFKTVPAEIVQTLKSEGYGVYRFSQGECFVISWSMKTGRISGKINMETLLKIITELATRSRNTLCNILTL